MNGTPNPHARLILAAFTDAWELIVERLTDSDQAWPDELIRLDLAWWADQATHPTAPRTRPGRVILRRRWCVSDKVARSRIATFDTEVQEARVQSGPGEGQPRARSGPGQGQVPEGETPETDGKGPAEGQVRARSGPGEGQVPPENDGQNGGKPPLLSPVSCLLSPDPEDPDLSGPEPGTRTTVAADRKAREDEALDVLWTHWRAQRRPARDGKPGRLWHTSRAPDADDLAKLRRALQARAAAYRKVGETWPRDLELAIEDARDLITCFHVAPTCAHWQGDNDRGTVFLGLGSLFKPDKLGTRWQTTETWRDAGRPVRGLEDKAKSANGYQDEADRAWSWLLKQIAARGVNLPRVLRPDDPVKDQAIRAAVKAVGGVTALAGNEQAVARLRWSFVRAYSEARNQPETTE